MDVLAFAARVLGQVVQAPGGLGGQCVDLANMWLLALGLPEVHANAVDWTAARIMGWAWVDNGPLNAPKAGDIVVWHSYPAHGIGVYGHIAVVLSADVMYLATLDQNWPEGSAVALRLHDYGGVAGWWRPL